MCTYAEDDFRSGMLNTIEVYVNKTSKLLITKHARFILLAYAEFSYFVTKITGTVVG